MYKALQTETGEEYIILSPYWLKHIDQLRTMDHADLLVCQGCRQPLRVKAGEVKRPHFAHKHLKACSYGSESLDILEARAVLYDWLQRYFGDAVTVEKQFAGSGLPRPVDCWVETRNGPIAYWIIEAGIRLEPREAIKAGLEKLGSKNHYVFLSAMLNEEKKEFHSALLTPTERYFLQITPFDEQPHAVGEQAGTLHYLDADQQTLITFRDLTLYHRPNWFRGRKKSAPLGDIRANMQDGSFTYAGELDRRNAVLQKRERLEKKHKLFEERAAAVAAAADEAETGPAVDTPPPTQRRGWGKMSRSAPLPAKPDFSAPLPCVTCGQITQDYWSTFFDENGVKYCRCRDCLAREI